MAQPPVLTGYGALDADWNAQHRADTNFAPGSAYNPDPHVPTNDAYVGDRYVAVEHLGGRVIDYQMNQYSGTDIQGALAAVKADLPVDTRVIWSQQKDVCMQYQFQSATLGQTLGPLDPQGGVLVEFQTYSKSSVSYSAANVGDALLAPLFDATAESSGGC